MLNYKQKLRKINTFIFDVDGVLTDGNLILLPSGEMVRTMNTKDGFAMQLAIKKGFRIVIISGGRDKMVEERLKYLGLTDIYLGCRNKMEAYTDLLYSYQLKPEEILYMGDDVPDLEVMNEVGLACCPNDAVADVRQMAEYISLIDGGKGCVRDVIEQTLKVQGKWTDDENTASV
ncbi:MAG: HAD-IIIA family hydrolase [Weeksellaceae bacterium]|jgi:3-deoxy-D-manno-octulosonate 8-phosphate phosphatase (KDO 8-P phosphatase)|nr:HAD-IIIA family hydrolase [Weeksellaceae bacterium]MDX9704484.1 HAD-IIIA family hydrolase [Weeksellaceae bacterium]